MSLSRSPSPRPNGGWASHGLTDDSSSEQSITGMNGFANNDAHWAAAKAKAQQVRGYPTIQSKNEGFFQRSRRKISQTLPTFNANFQDKRDWRESEKLGRGRWYPKGGGFLSRLKTIIGNILRKFKVLFILLAAISLLSILFSSTRMCLHKLSWYGC